MATVLTWGFLGSLAVLGFAHQIKILGGVHLALGGRPARLRVVPVW